jgi:hypothetical protein
MICEVFVLAPTDLLDGDELQRMSAGEGDALRIPPPAGWRTSSAIPRPGGIWRPPGLQCDEDVRNFRARGHSR